MNDDIKMHRKSYLCFNKFHYFGHKLSMALKLVAYNYA